MLGGTHTEYSPPDCKEFWELKSSYISRRTRGRTQTPSTNDMATPTPPPINVTVNTFDSNSNLRSSVAPSNDDMRSLDYRPSPVKRFEPQEYMNKVLLQYLTWCGEYFHDEEFLQRLKCCVVRKWESSTLRVLLRTR